jgi:hypothetical protein
MVEFAFADEMKCACRHCATFARANSKLIYERGLIPRPHDETATVTFIRFEGRTYAVEARHVIDIFRVQAERDGSTPESYFLPTGKGIIIEPPFIPAPPPWPWLPAPDVALRQIDDGLPAYIGKEAFELRRDIRPTYPVPYAAAVGFPTAGKQDRPRPLGKQLAMRCVYAVAQGVGGPESADQIQFFSEIEAKPEAGLLSGLSGGPVFWSDGNQLGLLGFVKEALDVEPRPGEESIYAGSRVNFIVQHVSYDTFGAWAEHVLHEWPKRRDELNRLAADKA